MNTSTRLLLAAGIEAAGIPALRAAFAIAFLAFAAVGIFIFKKRHALFDRDPNVSNDFKGARETRMGNVLFVWAALSIVLLYIFIDVWVT
ncbi:MAG TPA: hypothetical protein VJU77_05040 [Chthoniobacterales bacterium]|nr:hypothetical protein [Chthoniobacterales bacterium]